MYYILGIMIAVKVKLINTFEFLKEDNVPFDYHNYETPTPSNSLYLPPLSLKKFTLASLGFSDLIFRFGTL